MQQVVLVSPKNLEWMSAFRSKRGRAPRALHIGNIANNAYNNAKLLIEAGVECDVICYDYYHVMGCPEWEDADFAGPVTDQFHPSWIAAGVSDFERPRWFAQGPMMDCINYLDAKQSGRRSEAEWQWRRLSIASGVGDSVRSNRSRSSRLTNALRKRYQTLRRATRFFATGRSIPSRVSAYCEEGMGVRSELGKIATAILLLSGAMIVRVFASLAPDAEDDFDNVTSKILRRFAQEFPSRPDAMSALDLEIYRGILPHWRRLMAHYDVVIGYSTDPIYPLLAGKPYFALEHGTLREIPYQMNSIGRITALAYRMAEHVFVTNVDCVESAVTLAPKKFTLMNHPYDEDHGLTVSGWQEQREQLQNELDCSFLFFSPARQDWVAGSGYADKGNDVFLRAFAKLRSQAQDVGLVCCKWGSNVRESELLLQELGCAKNVKWVDPMGIVRFERMARACHCVVDQFKLGAFGGVLFKAMAVGAPVCTYLNEELILKQYSEPPPILNCKTEHEIFNLFSNLITNPARLTAIGVAGRAWIKRYHSKQATVNSQLDQFRMLFA